MTLSERPAASTLRTDTAAPSAGRVAALARLTRTMTFRLTALYVGVALIAGALVFLAIYLQTSNIVARQITTEIAAEVSDLQIAERTVGIALLTRLIEERMRSPGTRLYLLLDADGKAVAGNIRSWPREIRPGEQGATFRYESSQASTNATDQLAAGRAVELPGRMTLLVARKLDEQQRLATRIARLFLAGFAGLALAGLAGGLLASRFVLSRIAIITATARSIMEGRFSERVAISGSGDELDRLAGDLNQMLACIERLMASLKEVSDNIAHDLKTPLNRLRNHAEAALRETSDLEHARAALLRVTEEADDLIKTFNALLLIARLEAGARDERVEAFDVVELVTDIVELYQPLVDEQGGRLEFTGSTSAQNGALANVVAHRHLIGQAVANMIDNALKYGVSETDRAKGAEIEVTVEVDRARITIAVADRGPGIPVLERARVLERFVRLEKSRSRPGTGLGLSLVSAVARLSGGEVRLEDNTPGLRISLILPPARPA